jgi:hypothetical protein
MHININETVENKRKFIQQFKELELYFDSGYHDEDLIITSSRNPSSPTYGTNTYELYITNKDYEFFNRIEFFNKSICYNTTLNFNLNNHYFTDDDINDLFFRIVNYLYDYLIIVQRWKNEQTKKTMIKNIASLFEFNLNYTIPEIVELYS